MEDFFCFILSKKGHKFDLKEWRGEVENCSVLWSSYLKVRQLLEKNNFWLPLYFGALCLNPNHCVYMMEHWNLFYSQGNQCFKFYYRECESMLNRGGYLEGKKKKRKITASQYLNGNFSRPGKKRFYQLCHLFKQNSSLSASAKSSFLPCVPSSARQDWQSGSRILPYIFDT